MRVGACWFLDRNDEFVVVLPACNHDGKLLVRNLSWMRQLDDKLPYECVIAEDASTDSELLNRIRDTAASLFKKVHTFQYPKPPVEKWPQGPNWAFQSTARHMQRIVKRPWLWMEPDMVPLKPTWCSVLQREYKSCHQPIMGSFIEGQDHMNGTAIYPAYFPELSKAAMDAVDTAWDYVMRTDTMPISHNAGHLMFHCWGIINGKPHAFSGKEVKFDNQKQINEWIPRSAVTFHRCKHPSLINLLMSRKYANHSNLHTVVREGFQMAETRDSLD